MIEQTPEHFLPLLPPSRADLDYQMDVAKQNEAFTKLDPIALTFLGVYPRDKLLGPSQFIIIPPGEKGRAKLKQKP